MGSKTFFFAFLGFKPRPPRLGVSKVLNDHEIDWLRLTFRLKDEFFFSAERFVYSNVCNVKNFERLKYNANCQLAIFLSNLKYKIAKKKLK
jgi:hypothetical protein